MGQIQNGQTLYEDFCHLVRKLQRKYQKCKQEIESYERERKSSIEANSADRDKESQAEIERLKYEQRAMEERIGRLTEQFDYESMSRLEEQEIEKQIFIFPGDTGKTQ